MGDADDGHDLGHGDLRWVEFRFSSAHSLRAM